MTERGIQLRRFLQAQGWGDARRVQLAGDASGRRYERLQQAGRSAILMDADPAKGEQTAPFLRIARYLSGHGFSAPAVLGADTQNGFLLLEDLGDDLFARLVQERPDIEQPLYRAAAEMLYALHQCPPEPELPHADCDRLTSMIDLVFDPYSTAMGAPVHSDAQTAIKTSLHAALHKLAPQQTVTILRDFHAENLIWLPNRNGIARVGLLDFQDALVGHPAYDLASLLQDARRDVSADTARDALNHYITISGSDRDTFRAAYAVLGVQRNLRILGIFVRLCLVAEKPGYVDLIPRVWGHLMAGLAHPELSDLASQITAHIPAPTPAKLKALKQQGAR